jgi:16S rRNA (cytidine1402-2'-O)-methyltransferase
MNNNTSKLYIVPTPIGNLEDITFRAIKILKQVDIILAEDTRKTSILLKHYDIKNKTFSHHKFNEHKSVDHFTQIIKDGQSLALVSDAGTPSISDPGYLLVRNCIEQGVEVECLPGAVAFIPALVASGLPNDKFCFEGFLPQKKGRKKRLTILAEETRTIIFYVSPYKLIKTLEEFTEYFGSKRRASVSRELTKIYEETTRGTLPEIIEYYKNKSVIKGEIVVVVEGNSLKKERQKK